MARGVRWFLEPHGAGTGGDISSPINRNIEGLFDGHQRQKISGRIGRYSGHSAAPEPPDELTPQQAEEWREIVDRMPVDWFRREIHPLLCSYCRHVINARHIAGLIEAAHDLDIGDRKALMRFNRLLGMQERQSSALMGLATRMRLTNQSRYTASSAATAAKGGTTGKPLWEI